MVAWSGKFAVAGGFHFILAFEDVSEVGVNPPTSDEGETIAFVPSEVSNCGDIYGTPCLVEKFDAI